MRIVITGGCGFLGRRLALLLLEQGSALGGIDELVLFDNAPSALPLPDDHPRPRRHRRHRRPADGAATHRAQWIKSGTDAVFHLAAIVSGQAEADTDLGYRVNLDGTRAVLDACRALGSAPRVIFASSLAVYGGALPPAVGDDTALTPQSSYGTQKAIGELLVNDYSRKGFIDGRALRLPTVVVRPGLPNRAASTFASSMIREPLSGKDAVCPVSPETVMALASPRRVVASLAHALDIDGDALGQNRVLQLPGLFGVGRRHGRGAAPRRWPGGLCAALLATTIRRSRRSSAAGRPRSTRRAPRRLASSPMPASTRPSSSLSRTIWRCRGSWPGSRGDSRKREAAGGAPWRIVSR